MKTRFGALLSAICYLLSSVLSSEGAVVGPGGGGGSITNLAVVTNIVQNIVTGVVQNASFIKTVYTNNVAVGTNVTELGFTNTASVTVAASSNANRVTVSFAASTPTTATNISGGALEQVTNIAETASMSTVYSNNAAAGKRLKELEVTNSATITWVAVSNASRITLTATAVGDGIGIGTNAGTGWDTTIRSVSTNTVPLKIESQAGLNLTNFLQSATNGGVPFFVVSSNKYLGIGTNAPTTVLHVHGGTYLNGAISNRGAFFFHGTGGIDSSAAGANFGGIGLGIAAPGVYNNISSLGEIVLKAQRDLSIQNIFDGLPSTFWIGNNTIQKFVGLTAGGSNDLRMSFSLGGTNLAIGGTIYTATADKGVTNSGTETSIIGTGEGTLTLPANLLKVGRTVRITLRGTFSDDAAAPGTVDIKVKLGSTTVCTTGAQTPASAITNGNWVLSAQLTCRTAGASGSVMGQGTFENKGSALVQNTWGMINTAATTIDTTASQLVDVTWTWGTADSDNSTTCAIATVEILR